jgi:hypothetical protein
MPADAPMSDQGGRVRWGLSANLGWHVPTPAFTIGGEGHIGYQISNMFSAYAIVGGTAGIGLGVSVNGITGASVTATLLSYYYFGALAELMFGNLFYVAAGPVVANGVYATALVGASADGRAEVKNVTAVGVKPGIDVRLGLGFGRQNPTTFRRGGFNLGLDAMILFHPNSVITTVTADANGNAGVGVTTNGLTASVVPMLTLGYESR